MQRYKLMIKNNILECFYREMRIFASGRYTPFINKYIYIMEKRIETREPAVAIAYRLTGEYSKCDYGKAWQEIMKFCGANSDTLGGCMAEMEFINMYYDNPTQTVPDECRVDVCMVATNEKNSEIINALPMNGDIQRTVIPGGRYMVFVHRGSYKNLCDAYSYIYCKYLPTGEVIDDSEARGGIFEKYINNPETTKEEDLLTEIWIPIV